MDSILFLLCLFCSVFSTLGQVPFGEFPPWFDPWNPQEGPIDTTYPPVVTPTPGSQGIPDAVQRWQFLLRQWLAQENTVNEDCKWADYQSDYRCMYVSEGKFRIKRVRTKIPAKGNGADCVGDAVEYIDCTPNEYVASEFVNNVYAAARGPDLVTSAKPGGQRVLPGFALGRNPCTEPFRGSDGEILMMGKPCETQTRKRRNAEGLIETYEVPLKERTTRTKRQAILSTKHRDVLYLLDESLSITHTNFQKEVKMMKALTGKFCGAIGIGKSTTRVGVMTFDSVTHVHLDFDKYFERYQVLEFMEKGVKYTKATGKSTCLISALDFTRKEMITPARGARNHIPGTERMVVLFTDGCANCEKASQTAKMLKEMREKFEEQNISFLTFFIGKTDSCVKKMAGLADGSRCYQVFRAENWVAFDEMISHIEMRECMDAWEIGPSCTA